MRTSCRFTDDGWLRLRCWIASMVLAAAPFVCGAAIIIDHDLTGGDYVWGDTSQPYQVVEDVTVEKTASLRILPGVTVEFDFMKNLRVEGRLTAHGAQGSTITLTGMTKSPGSWLCIDIAGEEDDINGDCSFRYCLFEYGGWDPGGTGYLGGELEAHSADVSVQHCEFRNSAVSGAYATMNSSFDMRDCHFAGNAGYAVLLALNAQPPAYGSPDMRDSRLSGLTASGNGHDGVGVAESFALSIDRYTLEDPGLPYYMLASLAVRDGGSMLIEPGVTALFADGTGLSLTGPLTAAGTPEEPIVLTGINKTPGAWDGVTLSGLWSIDWTSTNPITWTSNLGSRLTCTTIEYGGGWQANLYLDHATAYLSNCVIRDSSNHGVRHTNAQGTVIEQSQIYDNQESGVYKSSSDEGVILAAYNWWGDPSGPYNKTKNPAGAGNEIADDAADFLPFLTSPNQEAGAEILSLTATPHRWFSPANGMASLTSVTISLRDGAGNPVPGRVVRLDASLGATIDGDITNINGQAVAYVYSNATGEATLTPRMDLAQVYPVRAAPAEVVFTEPSSAVDLFPDAEAPYVNPSITFAPLPIEVGVPVTITARVTNRSSQSLLLEANFVKHNYGIGLPLEILDTVTETISPYTEKPISTQWTPTAPGHQCVGLTGSFDVAPGKLGGVHPLAYRADSKFELPWLQNCHVKAPTLADLYNKQQATGVQEAVDLFNDINTNITMIFDGLGYIGGLIPGFMLDQMLRMIIDAWENAISAIRMDPPRQDYRKFAFPAHYDFSRVTAAECFSQAHADAVNAMMEANLDLLAQLRAARLSLDRFSGACEAGEQTWADQQATNFVQYMRASGRALQTAADHIDAFLQVLRDKGVADIHIQKEDYEALQARLRSTGFNQAERDAAAAIDVTSEDLEQLRQRIIASDAEKASRRSVMDTMEIVAAEMRGWVPSLIGLNPFGESIGGVASAPAVGARTAAKTDATTPTRLARIYQNDTVLPVGNPLSDATTVTMKIRRIDLPADWAATVSPTAFWLGAGEQTTVTVSLIPGISAPQGVKPRVAIEAYGEGRLLGGVEIDVMIPNRAPSLLAILLGQVSPSAEDLAAVDCNGDGRIDAGDLLTLILQ